MCKSEEIRRVIKDSLYRNETTLERTLKINYLLKFKWYNPFSWVHYVRYSISRKLMNYLKPKVERIFS